MYVFETEFRVLYAHTDKMGVMYYGNYPMVYEHARNEMLRSLGWSYREMEDRLGIMMPVKSMTLTYHASALYDDLLKVRVTVKTLPTALIHFSYEIFSPAGVLLNEGTTSLAFVRAGSFTPCRPPRELMDVMRPWFD